MSYGHQSNPDVIRQEQLAEGRRMEGTLTASQSRRPTPHPSPETRREPTLRSAPAKRKGPTGHDAVLTHFQNKNAQVVIKLASGHTVQGTIYGKDKFTITVLHAGGRETIYKHAIDSFMEVIDKPADVTEH